MNVLEGLLYSLKDISAAVSLIFLLESVFGEKRRDRKAGFIICILLPVCYSIPASVFLQSVFSYTYEVLDAVSNFFYIAAVFICLKRPAVFRSIAVLFIYIFTVDVLWSFVAELLGNSIIAECIFNTLLFSGVFAAVKIMGRREDINILAGAFREVPRWMIIALLLFELTCYYKEFGISAAWYDALYAVSACMIFVCILALVMRIFRLIYMQNSILARLNEQLLYTQQQSLSDEALRSFRHDYKNHIIVINSLFEQGDTSGAKEYFEKLKSDTVSSVNAFSTGNSVVNSLLNVKKADAAGCNAEIDFSGVVPEKGIDAGDMCICVGNLIDNAVEACRKLPYEEKKLISVSGSVRKNTMILTVKNPAGNIKFKKNGDSFGTTKKDVKAHGIGLKNVKSVAQKYSGELLLSLDSGVFTAELMLQFEENI